MDNDFQEEFNNFIEERINQNFSKLNSNEDYQNLNKSFNFDYSSFLNSLSDCDKKKLENLYAMINNLSGYENRMAYKIGFNDSLKIKML